MFKIGKTYSTRSACDYDTVFSFKVIARTQKTVKIQDKFGKVKTCRIGKYNDQETIKPMGSYSMAPILRA